MSAERTTYPSQLSQRGNAGRRHGSRFRRTKNDPVTVNWKSAIFIINVDGTGFHQLSDGTRTDFNPTWTRDGLNTPVWNRKNDRGLDAHRLVEHLAVELRVPVHIQAKKRLFHGP